MWPGSTATYWRSELVGAVGGRARQDANAVFAYSHRVFELSARKILAEVKELSERVNSFRQPPDPGSLVCVRLTGEPSLSREISEMRSSVRASAKPVIVWRR